MQPAPQPERTRQKKTNENEMKVVSDCMRREITRVSERHFPPMCTAHSNGEVTREIRERERNQHCASELKESGSEEASEPSRGERSTLLVDWLVGSWFVDGCGDEEKMSIEWSLRSP